MLQRLSLQEFHDDEALALMLVSLVNRANVGQIAPDNALVLTGLGTSGRRLGITNPQDAPSLALVMGVHWHDRTVEILVAQ